jgi:hypothetical protein
MIKFKLGKQTVNVASSWDDLTFNQFLQILGLKGGDIYQAISICSGIDYETLKSAKVIVGLEQLITAIQFMNTPAKFPDKVTTLGKYKLPVNPQLEQLDQFEDMRKIMIDSDKGIIQITEAYAKYCAIYIQPLRDGDYKFDSAMAMVDEVKQMPAKEVIPAGSFFLIKLLSLSTGIKTTSPPTSQTRKKSKPASQNYKKRSGSTPRFRKSR